jgi:TrpR-related protein YerC/YecD
MTPDRLRTPEVDALIEALLSLDDPDDMYALLQDLCTVREIRDMSQRLTVARMLAAGEHYADIQAATGASNTTISRVNRALHYGADGYRAVLDDAADGS